MNEDAPNTPPSEPQQDAGAPLLSFLKRHQRAILASGVLLCLIGGAMLVRAHYTSSKYKAAFKPLTQDVVRQGSDNVSQYCSRTGSALICQDVNSGKPTKYSLPDFAAKASVILPSRDENRFLIVSPANPLYPGVVQNVYITDKQFKIIKQLPVAEAAGGTGFNWAANASFIVYAKHADGDKNNFYVYDVDSGVSHVATKQSVDAGLPQVSADGKTIYAAGGSVSAGTFNLVAVDSGSGEIRKTDASDVTKHLKSSVNYEYNPATDLFYISGIDAQSHPVMVLAKYDNGKVVTVSATSDRAAYTPYAVTRGGIIASRQFEGKTAYGTLDAKGHFTASKITPSQNAQFGLSSAPQLKANADTSKRTGSDYYYSYVAPVPEQLRTYLNTLVAQDCPAGSYNQIDLMAQDAATQAVVNFTDCHQGVTSRRYYQFQDNAYTQVLQTAGNPDCTVASHLKLSKVIVPTCGDEIQVPTDSPAKNDNQPTTVKDTPVQQEAPSPGTGSSGSAAKP